MFKNNSEFQDVLCNSCQADDHPIASCSMMHYIPNRNRIIVRHLYSQKQERSRFTRRKFTKIRIKRKFREVQKTARSFFTQTEEFESSNILNDLSEENDNLNEENKEYDETKYKNLTVSISGPIFKKKVSATSPENNNNRVGFNFGENLIISPQLNITPLQRPQVLEVIKEVAEGVKEASSTPKRSEAPMEVLDDFERIKSFKVYYCSGNFEEVLKKLKKRKKGKFARIGHVGNGGHRTYASVQMLKQEEQTSDQHFSEINSLQIDDHLKL